MDKSDAPTPRSGDVIFTSETGFARWFSVRVQDHVDPWAKLSKRKFTHVALAVSSTMAIETVPDAVTETSAGDDGEMAKFVARRMAKLDRKKMPTQTAWSEVPLSPGVRVIPIADILVDAKNNNYDLAVMRDTVAAPPQELFDVRSDKIILALGSEYSVALYRSSIEAALARGDTRIDKLLPFWSRMLLKLGRLAPIWSSSKADAKSRTQLTQEQLESLSAYTDLNLHQIESRSYFCSQLVPKLLKESGLLSVDSVAPDISPTGLFKRLTDLGWSDVTASDYSDAAIQRMRQNRLAQTACGADYATYLRDVKWRLEQIALELHGVIIEKSVADMTALLTKVQADLDRLSPGTASRRTPP